MKIVIEHQEKLSQSEAYGYCVIASAEEVQSGTGSWQEVAFNWDNQAVVARNESGQIVGVIAWMKQEYLLKCYINQSWVSPAYRGKGVYRRLYKALIVKARQQGCKIIASGIFAGNKRMIQLALKQGRKPVATYYEAAL